jgi:hypothetical protein
MYYYRSDIIRLQTPFGEGNVNESNESVVEMIHYNMKSFYHKR